jgi:hypothetical protein
LSAQPTFFHFHWLPTDENWPAETKRGPLLPRCGCGMSPKTMVRSDSRLRRKAGYRIREVTGDISPLASRCGSTCPQRASAIECDNTSCGFGAAGCTNRVCCITCDRTYNSLLLNLCRKYKLQSLLPHLSALRSSKDADCSLMRTCRRVNL